MATGAAGRGPASELRNSEIEHLISITGTRKNNLFAQVSGGAAIGLRKLCRTKAKRAAGRGATKPPLLAHAPGDLLPACV